MYNYSIREKYNKPFTESLPHLITKIDIPELELTQKAETRAERRKRLRKNKK